MSLSTADSYTHNPSIISVAGITRTYLDQQTSVALIEFAEQYDLSESEATDELPQTGLARNNKASSQPSDDNHIDHSELAQRQRAIVPQQRQIVRFQKYTVSGGLGWTILTLATGANGPVWVAPGLLMIVLMASSTYI